MSSDNSAKPILVAGAVGTVALLGVAWMFAANAGKQAVINAKEYAESRALEVDANFEAKVEADDGGQESGEAPVAAGDVADADAAEPTEAEAETEAADAEAPAETETAAEEEKSEEEVAEAEAPAEEEVAEKDVPADVKEEAEAEAPAETEVAEAEAPAETEEVAEAEKPAETEEAAEAEKPEEAEVAAAETEAPAEETEVAAAETEAPAEAAVAATAVAAIAGDAKKGAKVYRKCKACHKIGEGAKNAVGPHLTGIVGRVMGSVDGFKYTDGFVAAKEEGKVWTPEELTAWLRKPKQYMPGTKMAFSGLRKDADLENVIAYLATDGE